MCVYHSSVCVVCVAPVSVCVVVCGITTKREWSRGRRCDAQVLLNGPGRSTLAEKDPPEDNRGSRRVIRR